jgi:hypothetical protein
MEAEKKVRAQEELSLYISIGFPLFSVFCTIHLLDDITHIQGMSSTLSSLTTCE